MVVLPMPLGPTSAILSPRITLELKPLQMLMRSSALHELCTLSTLSTLRPLARACSKRMKGRFRSAIARFSRYARDGRGTQQKSGGCAWNLREH